MVAKMERLKGGAEATGRNVGYVRLSTVGGDATLHVDAQKLGIRRFAGERGMEVIDWYADEGFSGQSLDRPALQQLLADVQSGAKGFDRVLVWSPDRMSSNAADFVAVCGRLSKAGVELVSVS